MDDNKDYDIDIPQDFLDIDAKEENWVMAKYEGKLWCVPDTNAKDTMSHAMMSEIPGFDDTVEPLKLTDKRWYKFMMAFLMQDGDLAVPGGRYGMRTETCAEVAIIMALCMQYHQGEPITYYSLNSDMSSVVNGSDGVASIISESQYIFDDDGDNTMGVDVKEVLGDEYQPQTSLGKIAKFCDVEIDGDELDGTLSLTLDNDDADKLIEAIKAGDGAFYNRQEG